MKKLIIFFLTALLIPSIAGATVFVSENWDTGTPAACWPCKTDSCPNQFNGWDAWSPAELGGTGHVPYSEQSSTQYHTAPYSYYLTKQTVANGGINDVEGCPIQHEIDGAPTTIFLRFYMYLDPGTGWEDWTDGRNHWIFTNSEQSSTGFRLNLYTNNEWSVCPVGDICMLPQGDGGNNEWYYTSKVTPDWPAGPDFKSFIGTWTCMEYKMEIMDNSTCSGLGLANNCVRLTEWVNGTLTRGPIIGPGQDRSSFVHVEFDDYFHAGDAHVYGMYLDDIVVSDAYIGLLGGDTTAPTVTAAAVNGSTVTVSFSETVVTAGYDANDFNLDCSVSGNDIGLSSPSGSGDSRTFTAASSIAYGETCNLDYVGSTNDIEDEAGNDLATFSNTAVTNNTTDTTGPTVTAVSIAINGQTVTVTFSENVVTTGYDNGDFNLDCASAGTNISLNSIAGSSNTRTLTAVSIIPYGDTCNMDYVGVADEIEDTFGNDLGGTLTDITVTNNSTQGAVTLPAKGLTFKDGNKNLEPTGGHHIMTVR